MLRKEEWASSGLVVDALSGRAFGDPIS